MVINIDEHRIKAVTKDGQQALYLTRQVDPVHDPAAADVVQFYLSKTLGLEPPRPLLML